MPFSGRSDQGVVSTRAPNMAHCHVVTPMSQKHKITASHDLLSPNVNYPATCSCNGSRLSIRTPQIRQHTRPASRKPRLRRHVRADFKLCTVNLSFEIARRQCLGTRPCCAVAHSTLVSWVGGKAAYPLSSVRRRCVAPFMISPEVRTTEGQDFFL